MTVLSSPVFWYISREADGQNVQIGQIKPHSNYQAGNRHIHSPI